MGQKNAKIIEKVEKSETAKQIERKRSACLDITSLHDKLRGGDVELLIEITPDLDYAERKKSVEWFSKELGKINCTVNVNYRSLHQGRGEFYVHAVKNYERKVVFSNSDSFQDAVSGSLICKKNYYMILLNIVEFLETKPTM
jgi:hypothetical protein